MKIIGGVKFDSPPSRCGDCGFWAGYKGGNLCPHDKNAICLLRNKKKGFWNDTPKVCEKLFRKCFSLTQDIINILE